MVYILGLIHHENQIWNRFQSLNWNYKLEPSLAKTVSLFRISVEWCFCHCFSSTWNLWPIISSVCGWAMHMHVGQLYTKPSPIFVLEVVIHMILCIVNVYLWKVKNTSWTILDNDRKIIEKLLIFTFLSWQGVKRWETIITGYLSQQLACGSLKWQSFWKWF